MARSSFPVISPFTCRLAPRRAVPLPLDDAGYDESIGAIVFASPEKDELPDATFVLGCCGSGVLAGASGFLSPHIYPPWAQLRRNQLVECGPGLSIYSAAISTPMPK